VISGLEPTEARDLILSVGVKNPRRPLSPLEVATYFKRALDAGMPVKELAEACLLSETMINRFTTLLKLSQKLHHLVVFGSEVGSISFTQAQLMTGLKDKEGEPDEEVQLALADAILENNLGKEEVRSVAQLIKRAKKNEPLSVEEAVNQVVDFRPTIERIWVLGGTIEEEELMEGLASITQEFRDRFFEEALTNLGMEASGHLGVDVFTLVTLDDAIGEKGVVEITSLVTEELSKIIK